MNKNILKLSLALAVIAAAGYTAYSSQTEVQLNGVALENVEALASGEGDYNYDDGYPMSFECGVKTGLFQHCHATVIVCQRGGDGCNERRCPQHG